MLIATLRVFVVALIGYVLARRGRFTERTMRDISTLVVNVAAPCLFFTNAAVGIGSMHIVDAVVLIVAAPAMLAIGWGCGWLVVRTLRVHEDHVRPVVAATTFQNASYLPVAVATTALPLLSSLFPQMNPAGLASSGVVCISLFLILYSPLFWGLGFWWIRGDSKYGNLKLGQLITPAVMAISAGYLVALTPLHLLLVPPDSALHFMFLGMTDLSMVTIPLVNLVLGGMLAMAQAPHEGAAQRTALRKKDRVSVVAGKLLIQPMIVFLILMATRNLWNHLASSSLVAFVLLLEAASPPATNLAVMGGSSRERATGFAISELLLTCYLCAIMTVPFWMQCFVELVRH